MTNNDDNRAKEVPLEGHQLPFNMVIEENLSFLDHLEHQIQASQPQEVGDCPSPQVIRDEIHNNNRLEIIKTLFRMEHLNDGEKIIVEKLIKKHADRFHILDEPLKPSISLHTR